LRPLRAAHDDQLAFHFRFVALGDEDGLLLHLVQRGDEQLLGLGAQGGEDIVGKGLGDRMGAVLLGQIGVGLDVDDLQGDRLGLGHGRFEGVEGLLRTIGAGGTDEHLDLPRLVDLFQDGPGRFVEIALAGADAQQHFQKDAAFFSQGGAQPTDVVTLRVEDQGR
jgi:hypothetical protein